MNVIEIKNLSKDYYLFESPLQVLMKSLFKSMPIKTFRALNEVSFSACRGETIGIVGHNGSGKSTLLQIITGVLKPTSGELKVNGRVAALLELGSGFNPEFTGLENIHYSASILGLSKDEIEQKIPKILSFADIGDFVNRPTKTYSSGMMLRLAFSVIINIEPDILIIDEALAVGDDAFQRKCYARLKELQENDVTILLVSHSAGQIIELCSRVVHLDHGEVLACGDPKLIINNYHKLLFMEEDKKEAFRVAIKNGEHLQDVLIDAYPQDLSSFSSDISPESTVWYEERGAKISSPRLINCQGNTVNILTSNHKYKFCYDVLFKRNQYNVGFGMLIKTVSGIEIGGGSSHMIAEKLIDECYQGQLYHVEIEFTCNLRNGTYFINCGCVGLIDGVLEFLHRGVDVLSFNVIEQNQSSTGIVDFNPTFEIIEAK